MSFSCVLHFAMSSCAFHLHVFQNLHPFGFPRFSPLSVLSPTTFAHARRPSQTLFRERDKKRSRNGRRFAEWPWYITGRPPVKFRSIWRSFDAPTVNRVPRKPLLSCSPTPLQISPLAHPTPLHALRRSITIVWAKTAPQLDSPSSLYL